MNIFTTEPGIPYIGKYVRDTDAALCKAAGILFYKKGAESKSVDSVLLVKEKPWNTHTKDYDPLALNVMGGKRLSRWEWSPDFTASRTFTEACAGEIEGVPKGKALGDLCKKGHALWFPAGRYCLYLVEATEGGELPKDLNKLFQERRMKRDEEEEIKKKEAAEKVGPDGMPATTKYMKQVEILDWVKVPTLLENKEHLEFTHLLVSLLELAPFLEFLKGGDLKALAAKAAAEEKELSNFGMPVMKGGKGGGKWGKGKGKDFGGGFKGGFMDAMDFQGGKWAKKGSDFKGGKKAGFVMMDKGGYKGQPSMGMDMNMYSNGTPAMGMPAPVQMMMPFEAASPQMQRQLIGADLFPLVQKQVEKEHPPYIVQKITGMLLELPQDELLPLLTNNADLTLRVEEALEVLKQDGRA